MEKRSDGKGDKVSWEVGRSESACPLRRSLLQSDCDTKGVA